ncbi:hypothetical protein MRB53_030546 [Persea americana]|uniref:Uncharacterized protein n=1 Tax=Persea americana TaxID=3435 RepID=A0ACC2KLM5_PERAE|nr:hypothetical protein MRB53_030546 [Persea americana]
MTPSILGDLSSSLRRSHQHKISSLNPTSSIPALILFTCAGLETSHPSSSPSLSAITVLEPTTHHHLFHLTQPSSSNLSTTSSPPSPSHRQAQETSSPSPLSIIRSLSRLPSQPRPPSAPYVDHRLQPSLSFFVSTRAAHTLIPIHHLPLHLQAHTDPSHHHLGLASSITTLCRSTIPHASSSISHTTPSLPHVVISLSHQTPHVQEERTSKEARQGLGISCQYHRGIWTSSSNGFVIQSKSHSIMH